MFKKIAVLFVLVHVLFSVTTIQAIDSARFAAPSVEDRPWVYWFWNNGNLTKEGITADLEAMQRVGIGGVLIMEVGMGAPKGPVEFLGDQWREMFRFMLSEAERLGLEVNMNNGPGWNGSGGPWIKPEDGMQQLTWSEVKLTDRHYNLVLPQPESKFNFYKDIVVLAFRMPESNPDPEILGPDHSRRKTPQEKVLPSAVVPLKNIIDISKHMEPTGSVRGGVPGGNVVILRFGHTCKGVLTRPAPETGLGLECDKLSKRATDATFYGQIGKLVGDNKELIGKTFVSTHIDSWENGGQNWTETMREEFLKRRKYDLLPYLPVFAGYVVESPDHTERFLWDFRRTVSELVLDNHVRRMSELSHQHGLRLSIEAYSSPCDHLEYAGIADEPMGEFWVDNQGFLPSCRGMASAGHVYGRKIIGAEAFTANAVERWQSHPGSMKALGDRVFAEGINRFVFHRYSFQPWNDVKPGGLMMGPFGVFYERTQTWWEQSPGWHEYLSRCQYMLRQGDYVADICYVGPEEKPSGFQMYPETGYPWDQCDTHAVLLMRVEDGKLVLPSGMCYEILVLQGTNKRTPELMEKLRDLIHDGATVILNRPVAALGLSDYPNNDRRVLELAAELWGEETGVRGERAFGKGKLVWGEAPETILKKKGISPDVTANRRVRWIHRRMSDKDVYFVANPEETPINVRLDLRAVGRPEIWHPETGKTSEFLFHHADDTTSRVLLPLGPTESVFLVFFRNEKPNAENDPVVQMTRDGNLVEDLTIPTSRITVHKAEYGVPDEPATFVDVKETVEKTVADGLTQIPVGRISSTIKDPKHGVVKKLRIEYSYGNRGYTVAAPDQETVFLDGCMPKIKVLRATYGAPKDDTKKVDVRELLQNIFDAGENHFSVARLIRSIPDPAHGIEKELEFEYELNGQTATWRGTDRTQLGFDDEFEEDVRIRYGADRSSNPFLLIETPGKYECRTASGRAFEFEVVQENPFELNDAWTATFPFGEIAFNRLSSWNDSDDEQIRYFSGNAVYKKTFDLSESFLNKNKKVRLDLGKVDVMADLTVNGKKLGVLWKLEKETDVTELLKPGENTIEITVTNLWPNRLIGDDIAYPDVPRNGGGFLNEWPQWLLDGKPDPSGRTTFCMWKLWNKNDRPLSSGLIGPVRIICVPKIELESSVR